MARGYGSNLDNVSASNNGSTLSNLQRYLQSARHPTEAEVEAENRELLIDFAEYQLHNQENHVLETRFSRFVEQADIAEEQGGPVEERPIADSGNMLEERLNAGACPTVSRSTSPKPPLASKIGTSLKQLADDFAKTREREDVRKQAERLELQNINKDDFKEILKNLFVDRQNLRERIVVLFFFCTDVIIKTLSMQNSIRLFKNLMQWSLSYINNLIYSAGGWEQILPYFWDSFPKFVNTVCVIAVAVAAVVYIRKNW